MARNPQLALNLLSGYLNIGLKDLFQQPRPFDLDPTVQLADAEGYGLPNRGSSCGCG